MADFKLGFSLNTAELEKGKKALNEVADAAGNLSSAESKRKTAHDTADAALSKTISTSKQAEASAQRYIQSIKMEEQALKSFEAAQKALNTALDQGKLNAQQHARYIKQVGEAYADAKKQAEQFRSAQTNATANTGFGTAMGTMRGIGEAASGLGGVLAGGGGLGGAMEGVAGIATRLGGSLGPVGIGLTALAAGGIAAQQAFTGLILPLATVQDRFTAYQARINLVLKDQDLAEASMARVIDSANAAGVSLDAALGGFERILRNKDSLAASTEEIETLMATVQQLGAISNTSTGEMQGAMIQFSQAIASGRLNGDELRSIMESMPSLAKAIADGLGVGVGELRRMGAEGQLTGDKVFKALLSQTDKVKADFEELPNTTERSLNRIGNQWDMLKNRIAAALNASEIAQGIIGIGETALKVANAAFEEDPVSEKVTEKTKQLAAAKKILADEEERYQRILAQGGGGSASSVAAGIEARRSGIERLTKELAALKKQEDAAAATKSLEDDKLAEQRRAKLINDAVAAAKAAGYDKEQQELIKLNAALDSNKAALQAALKAREDLRQKNLQAAAQEGAALALVTKAVENLRQAMASGKPIDIAIAAAQLTSANVAVASAAKTKKETGDQLPVADENIRILQQGNSGISRDIRNVGGGGKGGGAESVSQIEQLRRTVGDLRKALADGAMGGEIEFLTQSAAAERDKKGTGAETRRLLEEQRALQGANQLEQLKRQAEQQNALTEATGKSRAEIREIEIAQKAYNYQIETFGRSTSPFAKKAVEQYTEALRAQTEASDRAAAAQKVLSAQQQAAASAALLAAAPDEMSQGRVRFETQLSEELKGIADPAQRSAFEKARREEFSNQQLMQQREMVRSQEEELQFAEERLKLAGLASAEYEIQLRLLQKRKELEGRGIDPNQGFGAETMMREEATARREQIITGEETRKREFIRKWEGTADRVGALMSNSFDVAFDSGLKSAGNTFLKGMGSIFKQMGNNLVYEIAIRPVQELVRGLMQIAAQKLLTSIIGGAIGGSVGGGGASRITPGIGPERFAANGMAFMRGGYEAFAAGGAFTNQIISSPTLFAFAGGTGLMGEAGPEAIMPLKRGANGKLGVEAAGDGGGTTIVINDMRSGPGAEPVQTQERRGPDGRRMISVLIRDEVRRQIRSGDLDREMQTSYGANRQLARK